jgi:hypothetical protein
MYMNISTIQVHENYKLQETENTEEPQKIHEKVHNTLKALENKKKTTENINILPGKEPGPSSL